MADDYMLVKVLDKMNYQALKPLMYYILPKEDPKIYESRDTPLEFW